MAPKNLARARPPAQRAAAQFWSRHQARYYGGTDIAHDSGDRTRMATAHTSSLAHDVADLLAGLGLITKADQGGTLVVRSPITGEVIGRVHGHDAAAARHATRAAHSPFVIWRTLRDAKRGELIRLLGNDLRRHKDALGRLVSIEVGKIISEGLGEVQEMIDICDFAVGQSRQLYGLTIATERPEHRMMWTLHPSGFPGLITAFHFPLPLFAR